MRPTKLTTPRAAAVAGIVFAVLMGTSYVLVRLAVPASPNDLEWIEDRAMSSSSRWDSCRSPGSRSCGSSA